MSSFFVGIPLRVKSLQHRKWKIDANVIFGETTPVLLTSSNRRSGVLLAASTMPGCFGRDHLLPSPCPMNACRSETFMLRL